MGEESERAIPKSKTRATISSEIDGPTMPNRLLLEAAVVTLRPVRCKMLLCSSKEVALVKAKKGKRDERERRSFGRRKKASPKLCPFTAHSLSRYKASVQALHTNLLPSYHELNARQTTRTLRSSKEKLPPVPPTGLPRRQELVTYEGVPTSPSAGLPMGFVCTAPNVLALACAHEQLETFESGRGVQIGGVLINRNPVSGCLMTAIIVCLTRQRSH